VNLVDVLSRGIVLHADIEVLHGTSPGYAGLPTADRRAA